MHYLVVRVSAYRIVIAVVIKVIDNVVVIATIVLKSPGRLHWYLSWNSGFHLLKSMLKTMRQPVARPASKNLENEIGDV